MPVHESDICIIGGGISSAMLARKLANLRPGTTITIVEAGRSIFDFEKRASTATARMVYGEHPWRNDYLEDQQARGVHLDDDGGGRAWRCTGAARATGSRRRTCG